MKKLMKMGQHKFVKLAYGDITREEIDLTIQFMREHPGFISYHHLMIYANYVTKAQTYRGTLRELEDISQYCNKMELNLSY
nr:MAG TPA: hypothetical protein [Caudoviricetes sp.]